MLRPATITAFISELIDTHTDKCDGDHMQNGDAIPHIVSSADAQTAMIEQLDTCFDRITLKLSTGQTFILSLSEA